ncbi:Transcription factor [Acorus gramineus]|uniref:Transcription factor n=1 Tax=Acorus gramineus TaxID=55184 RepID=A0AAV9AM75_ACOGR|nr:Transcription factor [Acorus gramineus]
MKHGQSSDGGDWLLDYGLAQDVRSADLIWTSHVIDDQTVTSTVLGFDVSHQGDNCLENACFRKRTRPESCAAPGTKACREKMRRDRLNDRFIELCSILEPGRPPKADKVAVLSDAARFLNQLRLEAKKLKEMNEALQDKIKNLKAEKVELRDEKVSLKAEKEKMEQLIRGTSIPMHPMIPHPATAFHATPFPSGNKAISYPNYIPLAMWQWLPQTALDTSQDHVLRPPVA